MTPHDNTTDKPWLQAVCRAQEGDRQAFALLVHEFSPLVYHVAYGVLWQTQDAEDVVQETFLKAYVNLRELRDPRMFAGWLGRIARNLALNRQRWRRTRPEVGLTDPDLSRAEAATDQAAESLLAAEVRAAMQAAIRGLPEHYRSALMLRVKAGLSYEEIAAILEIPVGTVRSRIHAARERLAAVLRDQSRQGLPG